jgi:thiol-disulfide isomerase/thioredoxin
MIASIRVFALFSLMLLGTAHAGSEVDFTLEGVDGREYSLSDYRGKWVVVNYWATWCPPCLEEIPELVHFHEQHKDKDAVVLGVNMEDIDKDALAQFVEENFITYPVLRQKPGMTAVGPVPGLPTTYLVSPEGEVVGRKLGGITAEDIDTYIQEQSK